MRKRDEIRTLFNNFAEYLEKYDLDSLIYMTRKHEDWCIDLMCDAYYNHTFSISDALKLLEKDFFLLGSSPNIMTDFRWYKSLSNNYEEYNNYFYQKFMF